jgi:hypothetical protein
MAGALFGRRRLVLEAKAAWEHPDEPWKWRPDWAQGHVLDGSRRDALGMTIFAVLWNLVSLPGGVLAFREGLEQGRAWAPLALVFPAIGVGLAGWAGRAALRARRFGVSRLELAAVPVPVGRTLAGAVHTRLTTPPPGGFALTLTALRTTRGGPDHDVATRVLWQDEAHSAGQLSGDGEGVHVIAPVAMRIPPDAPGTDHSDPDDEVSWRLEVEAETPGLDYAAAFELPVYRTEDSDQAETARDAAHLEVVPDAPALRDSPRPEPRSAIVVAREGDGLVIDFPPARNPGMATGLTAFVAVWTGAIVLMTRLHAPILFPVAFGLFDLLLGWFALGLWCEVTRLGVDASGARVASGLGAPGKARLVPRDAIADVRIAIGMTASTTAYYDLRLVTTDGRAVTVGGGIRHKREAEWLAAQVLGALGQPRRA